MYLTYHALKFRDFSFGKHLQEKLVMQERRHSIDY